MWTRLAWSEAHLVGVGTAVGALGAVAWTYNKRPRDGAALRAAWDAAAPLPVSIPDVVGRWREVGRLAPVWSAIAPLPALQHCTMRVGADGDVQHECKWRWAAMPPLHFRAQLAPASALPGAVASNAPRLAYSYTLLPSWASLWGAPPSATRPAPFHVVAALRFDASRGDVTPTRDVRCAEFIVVMGNSDSGRVWLLQREARGAEVAVAGTLADAASVSQPPTLQAPRTGSDSEALRGVRADASADAAEAAAVLPSVRFAADESHRAATRWVRAALRDVDPGLAHRWQRSTLASFETAGSGAAALH